MANNNNIPASIHPSENGGLESMKNLELYSGLTIGNNGEINALKNLFSSDINEYYLALHLLVYGVTATEKLGAINIDPKNNSNSIAYSTEEAKRMFDILAKSNLSKSIIDNTAYGKQFLTNYGKAGVSAAQNNRYNSSPITGPKKHTPSLTEKLLNDIHPQFVEKLESFCNSIRTRSYLSLPPSTASSIQKAIAKINGVVSSFQSMIYDVYQGAIDIIQGFYTVVNTIALKAQAYALSLVENVIPSDISSMLLDTIQVLADDIDFYTSLFGQSASISKYMNSFQDYLQIATTLNNNPTTTLAAYLPPDIKQIFDLVDRVGTDPNGFLGDALNNYGYGYVLNALQGDILGAAVNKFGPEFAAFGPIGNLLTQSENYQKPKAEYPKTPASIGPVYHTDPEKGILLDANLNPTNGFISAEKGDFIKVKESSLIASNSDNQFGGNG